MLRRSDVICSMSAADMVLTLKQRSRIGHHSMMYVGASEAGRHFGFGTVFDYREHRDRINPATHLLIVNPSGEVRTLRDADIGLDVLPADWHERSGEELFALGKPFAFGGEEPADRLPPPPDALIDNEEVKVDIGASRPVDVRKPLVISVAAKDNEPAFEVPDVAAIARKAARERVEHLRSVRDAIGWPFV